mmetsp:Transcript_60268/g.113717  ORF Transcript_60268/g.113717 Transcript_60268/m.113717 type:complete len:256 (-) Transcript_60268:1283-2050(-)
MARHLVRRRHAHLPLIHGLLHHLRLRSAALRAGMSLLPRLPGMPLLRPRLALHGLRLRETLLRIVARRNHHDLHPKFGHRPRHVHSSRILASLDLHHARWHRHGLRLHVALLHHLLVELHGLHLPLWRGARVLRRSLLHGRLARWIATTLVHRLEHLLGLTTRRVGHHVPRLAHHLWRSIRRHPLGTWWHLGHLLRLPRPWHCPSKVQLCHHGLQLLVWLTQHLLEGCSLGLSPFRLIVVPGVPVYVIEETLENV